MNRYLLIFALCAITVSCDNNGSKDNSPIDDKDTSAIQQGSAGQSTENHSELIVVLDKIRLRDKAGLDGVELEQLTKGTKLTFLGEISNFTTKIMLRGIQYDDPWLKVQIKEGQEGWIYGGAVKFKSEETGETLKNVLITKRLQRLFGSSIVKKVEAYQQQYKKTTTEEEFVTLYRNNNTLVEDMNEKLLNFFQIEKLNKEGMDYPDLFWIDDPIPAMTLSLVAEGTIYQIYSNINDLSKKAKQTKGDLDDEFVAILNHMYDDAVAEGYPSWFLQTWDYGGYSLLGQGKHTSMLDKLEALSTKTTLFNDEIINMKNSVVSDIIDGQHYGETSETILNEIDAILNNNYSILTESDVIVIKNRRPMFVEPDKFEISVYEKNF